MTDKVRRAMADRIEALEADLIAADAKADWWQERAEDLEAENARLVARLEVYEGAQSGPIKTTGVVDSLAGAAAALEAENARLRATLSVITATDCYSRDEVTAMARAALTGKENGDD